MEKLKSWALFFVSALAAIGTAAAYLFLKKNIELKTEIELGKLEGATLETKTLQKGVDSVAADSISEYERLSAEFRKNNPLSGPSDLPPGSSGR